MSTDDDKEDRLRRGYNLLYCTSRELASRFIDLADQLEHDYPMPERLLADLVDLTLEEVVSRTRWRPSRLFLMILLEQRIRRAALAAEKKRKATIKRKKLKAAAEARRKAKEEAAREVGGAGARSVESAADWPCSRISLGRALGTRSIGRPDFPVPR